MSVFVPEIKSREYKMLFHGLNTIITIIILECTSKTLF